ncbi:nuclear receptor NHR-1, partial [Aphelenchoides avenae]
MPLSGKRVTDGQLCLICEGPAKGYNYGVASCHGCKTFFHRSVLSGESFVCQKEGNCDVTAGMRNACRKCRLDKCKRFGMDASALAGVYDKRSNIIKAPIKKEEGWTP